MTGLPAPYGTGALEPPDEVDDTETGEHRTERINLVNRCVSCGDVWPCETSTFDHYPRED